MSRGVALGELPGTSESVSPQVLAWKGSGGQTRRLQCPQALRKAVNPTAAGGPGGSVHAVSLLCPSTLSRCQGNAYRTLVGTEYSSEVHGAQGRPSRPSGRHQAGLCPTLSTGPCGRPVPRALRGPLRPSPGLSAGLSGRPRGSPRAPPAVLDPAGFCPLPCKTDPTPFSSSTLGHTPLLFQKVGRALTPKSRESQASTESALPAGW